VNYKSHGEGSYIRPDMNNDFVAESTVRIFHPDEVLIGNGTYIGHHTIIKGYPYNTGKSVTIGEGCWIGENCYLHGAGAIIIEDRVGIGPGTYILTSYHLTSGHGPLIENPLVFNPVVIKEGADIEAKSFICAGVTIGRGAIVRAGSVVVQDVKDYAIVAGNPAKFIRLRKDGNGKMKAAL